LEAGLGWITKFSKNFTAKEILGKQKAEGVKRKLVGFEMIDKGIARHGYEIANSDNEIIGFVTSGTQSPGLNKAIGMGYVKKEFSATGTQINIKIRDKLLRSKVVKIPFE
jgi:aminomethyltransferase